MLSLLRHRFVRLADVLEPLNRKARCICAEPLLLRGQLEVARMGSRGLRHGPACRRCRCARTAGNTISTLSQRSFSLG